MYYNSMESIAIDINDISFNNIYKNDSIKKKRLYLSWILTCLQFVTITLQIIQYITSQRAIVSGWSKLIGNCICGIIIVYLKCSSYDKEYNNKFHLCILIFRRIVLFSGFILMVYIDSKNNFESFKLM